MPTTLSGFLCTLSIMLMYWGMMTTWPIVEICVGVEANHVANHNNANHINGVDVDAPRDGASVGGSLCDTSKMYVRQV